MTTLTHWNILLIDDEPDSLKLICEMLALNGAEVHYAGSGAEGLSLLQQFIPTLIVLDLSMPKPDGWDLLAIIRGTPSTANVPVIAVTAYYSEKVLVQAHKAGFNALVPKPIKVGALISKLHEIVD